VEDSVPNRQQGKSLPEKVPAIGEVIIWIARLGGFLARKSDGMPGTSLFGADGNA